MKIVVIEDNPDIIDVVDCILSGNGHEMIPCQDGSIANRLDQINPDLIFIDEFLPVNAAVIFAAILKPIPRCGICLWC